MGPTIHCLTIFIFLVVYPVQKHGMIEVLAEFEGGSLTLSEFRAYLEGLPDSQKVVPQGEKDRQEWVRAQIAAAAIAQILGASEEVTRQLEEESFTKRRRWLLVEALAASFMETIRAGVEPDESEVAARVAEIRDRARQRSLYGFRQIFLSTAEAATEGDKQKVREKAQELVTMARSGEDFAELANTHSQSPEPQRGGLVNSTLHGLEDEVAQTLATMKEGEVSGIVAGSGGFHILKLERVTNPAGDPDRVEKMARSFLKTEAQKQRRETLLKDRVSRFGLELDRFPYRIGEESWSKEDWRSIAAMRGIPEPRRREALAEQILLAQEAVARGLKTEALEAGVESELRREAVRAAYYRRLGDFIGELPEEPCRALYDAQPDRFALGERVDLDLIFVPMGEDRDKTLNSVKKEAARLGKGHSFAELAREISSGPKASSGGALGVVELEKLAILNPAIYRVVGEMKAGEISEPFYCGEARVGLGSASLVGGYAIVKINEKHSGRTRTFEEALQDVRKIYYQENSETLEEAFKKSLLDQKGFRVLKVPEMSAPQR